MPSALIRGCTRMDLFYLGLLIFLTGLTYGYLRVCARLEERK